MRVGTVNSLLVEIILVSCCILLLTVCFLEDQHRAESDGLLAACANVDAECLHRLD